MNESDVLKVILGFIFSAVAVIGALIAATVRIVKMIRAAKEELGLGQKKVADKVDANTKITDLGHSQADTATVVKSALRDATNASTRKETNIKAALDTAAATIKQTVLDTTADQNSKLAEIHGMVNGKMDALLVMAAAQAKRIADLTGHPDDLEALRLAEKIRDAHQEKIRAASGS